MVKRERLDNGWISEGQDKGRAGRAFQEGTGARAKPGSGRAF